MSRGNAHQNVAGSRLIRLGVVFAILAAVVAACSSPATEAPVATTEAPAAMTEAPTATQEMTATEAATTPATEAAATLCGLGNGQAATGDPIKVGGIVGATGPADWSSAGKGAAAYFKCVNANGGINGRPVEYIVEDDGWDPEKASAAGAKLVNDDKVVALVGNTSFVECAANAKLYADSNVIDIAGVAVPRECFEAANIVPTNQGPRLSNLTMAQYAYKTWGAKKFTCIAPNIPNVGVWGCVGISDWGKDKGVTVDNVLIDPATLDPTSTVLQATSTNPDAITVATPSGVAIPIFKAAQEQDLREKYHWMGPTTLYDIGFPEAVGDYWNGYINAAIEFNQTDSTGPDDQAWLKVIDQYGDAKDPRDSFSQSGFLAAKIFTDTVLKLDPAKVDRGTVTAALQEIKNYKSDLLCAPWYFGKGATKHFPNHAGRIVQLDGGKWKLAADCTGVEDPDLQPVLDLEKSAGLVGP